MNGDPSKGPPLRPLVSAKSSPNAPLSSLLSVIVRDLRSELNNLVKTELLSGESLLSEIDSHNDNYTKDPTEYEQLPVPRSLRPRDDPRPNPRISNPIQSDTKIIGSMDACALFPSVKQNMAVEAVVKTSVELKYNFPGAHKDIFSKAAG